MKKLLLGAALGLGVLLSGTLPSAGWAMGIAPLTKAEKKSKFNGIKGLTHHHTRVHGVWANGQEHYQFKGTTKDCQEFLNHLGTLEGIASKEVQLARGGADPKTDWALLNSHTTLVGKKEGKEGPVIRVTIYLGGKVDHRKLVVPKGITVLGKPADA